MYGDERYALNPASNCTILFIQFIQLYPSYTQFIFIQLLLYLFRDLYFCTSLEISKGNQETGRDKLSLRKRGPWSILEIARLVSRGNDSEG